MCVYTSLCLVFGLRSSVFGRYPVLWLECTVAWWAPSTSLNTVAYLFIIILFGDCVWARANTQNCPWAKNKDITKCLKFNITRKSHSQHKLYKIFIFHNSLSISLTDSSVRVSVTIYGERKLKLSFCIVLAVFGVYCSHCRRFSQNGFVRRTCVRVWVLSARETVYLS